MYIYSFNVFKCSDVEKAGLKILQFQTGNKSNFIIASLESK